MDMVFNLAICIIGLALHIAMKWNEARMKVELPAFKPGLWTYIKIVPAQTLIAVLATAAAFSVTWSLGWMNPGMALASGYMGNSIVENVLNHVKSAARSRK